MFHVEHRRKSALQTLHAAFQTCRATTQGFCAGTKRWTVALRRIRSSTNLPHNVSRGTSKRFRGLVEDSRAHQAAKVRAKMIVASIHWRTWPISCSRAVCRVLAKRRWHDNSQPNGMRYNSPPMTGFGRSAQLRGTPTLRTRWNRSCVRTPRISCASMSAWSSTLAYGRAVSATH